MHHDYAMEELHVAVLRAYLSRLEQSMKDTPNGVLDIPSRDDVFFILAAATPIIEAREREACAKVVEETRMGTAFNMPIKSFATVELPKHSDHKAIAAAIRARGET